MNWADIYKRMIRGFHKAMHRRPLGAAILAGVLVVALALAAAPAAQAGSYCPSSEPYVYVWGFEEERGSAADYYYTGVIRLSGDESRADLVAEFAERARDQHRARPSAKPSRCFESSRAASADLERRRRVQSEGGARQFTVRW